MRFLRILVIVLGLAGGLPLGFMLLLTTMQVRSLAEAARETPDVLPAAQLARKGAPDNLHVELTDFTFGKPVAEKSEDGGLSVWLPVEPPHEPKKPPKKGKKAKKKTPTPTIFYRANFRDQAALDEFVKQPRLEAL